jgi:ferrous iron transport protein A/ferrous iron transport protein B
MTLKDLRIGESGRVLAVGGEKRLRRRLLDMGITPRTLVTVKKAAPMGDPIELIVRGYVLTLRLEDAGQITVEGAEQIAAENTAQLSAETCSHCSLCSVEEDAAV